MLRRIPWWVWVAAAVVAVALLAVPLGGWQHVDRAYAEAEVLPPGRTHEADRFDTAVERAVVQRRAPGSSFDPDPGIAYLVVYARLEAVTDRTESVPTDHLVVTGAGDLDRAESVVLTRDLGSGFAELQPGLPEEVGFVYEIQDGAVGVGDELRVQVVDRTADRSYLRTGTTWVDPRVGAVVTLAVEARS